MYKYCPNTDTSKSRANWALELDMVWSIAIMAMAR